MKEANEMHTRLAVLVVVGTILLSALIPAAASAQTAPGGGPAFGQHVAGMAPEHARMHGAMFGQCVSTMARTGACPPHP
jgi:hypothetical protein